MAAAAGLAGAVAMAVGGYLRSRADKRKSQMTMIMQTPCSNPRFAGQGRMGEDGAERDGGGACKRTEGRQHDETSRVGETWTRPDQAVPDRFGKMHIAILDEIIEVCQKVKCEGKAGDARRSLERFAVGKHAYSEDNMNSGKCSWYQEETACHPLKQSRLFLTGNPCRPCRREGGVGTCTCAIRVCQHKTPGENYKPLSKTS
eukprot:768512-Hanusia_phi.AAC.4